MFLITLTNFKSLKKKSKTYNMEKKQTPIDWLFEQIPLEYTSTRAAFEAKKIAEQMFEEQIK